MHDPVVDLPEWIFLLSYVVLAASLVLAFFRMMRGPSLPDRIIALDLSAVILLCVAAVYAMQSGQHLFLDAALVIAVILFIGTVAFARYIEKGIKE